jgi:hypothetical protein
VMFCVAVMEAFIHHAKVITIGTLFPREILRQDLRVPPPASNERDGGCDSVGRF